MLTSCGFDAPTPDPDFVLRLASGIADTPAVLHVIDEAEVVVDARPGIESLIEDNAALALASVPNTASTVQVEWTGLMCESAPVLTISARDEGLLMHLDHGPSPSSCPALGVDYRVRLVLDPGVSIDSFDLEEATPSREPD